MLMTPVRGPDADQLFARALLDLLGGRAELVDRHPVPWASATFTGTRHAVRLRCNNAETAAAAARMLPEAEFSLRGHLVADVVAVADGRLLAVEALTLEEA